MRTIERPSRPAWRGAVLATLMALLTPGPARANIELSRIILDLSDPKERKTDITVSNPGKETMYVTVEPAEIVNPGTGQEQRVPIVDPRQTGLLVSPNRFVLEPGARRLVRLVRLAPSGEQERIYRMRIAPTAGGLEGEGSGVRLLFGFDALVILRPQRPRTEVVGERRDRTLVLENRGNTNAVIFEGRHCDAAGQSCQELPVRRLYAGNRVEIPLSHDTPVTYRLETMEGVQDLSF